MGERFIEWNFVSSSRERIEQAKADWRAGRIKLPDLDHDEFILCRPTGRRRTRCPEHYDLFVAHIITFRVASALSGVRRSAPHRTRLTYIKFRAAQADTCRWLGVREVHGQNQRPTAAR